eukprot:TCALIF_12089-PA protein Name:"Similar to Mmp14 Matrix metalloproteinase-14 (Rattus norvegicus)" AED:0.09 eAED:0.09 QI:65/1/0.8/1/1/1/5/0/473
MDRLAPTRGPSQWACRMSFVIVIICTHQSTLGRPVGEPIDDAMMYLMKYGYMDETGSSKSAALIHPDAIKESIMEFQRFAGLNETGVMDPQTSRLMKLPRCGVKDMVGHSKSHGRSKRFALQGSRWRVKEITYRISSYPSKKMMPKSDVDSEIARALAVWSEFTDLKFVPRDSGKVHIDIRFEEGRHGDGDPFDGQGGTLAHAFFPVFGGDAHFDDAEFWTKDSFVGTNLLQTAAHEFGHSLGLSHSDSKNALMSPFYRGFEKEVQLKKDDIEGIQQLYGEKTTSSRPSSTRPEVPEVSDEPRRVDDEELCNDASFDAIVTLKNGDTFTFKGGKYWKLTDESVANGYPRDLSSDWDGLPPNVDAAFTWTNGKTYFFKGSKYWSFTNQVMDSGYPKQIAKGFEGIPNSVDGAFVWTGNEKIYFFKVSRSDASIIEVMTTVNIRLYLKSILKNNATRSSAFEEGGRWGKRDLYSN